MKTITALTLLFCAFNTSANGDKLVDTCYHSMKYTIAVQLAGNSLSEESAKNNIMTAHNEGNWLGVDATATDRMIKMTSGAVGAKAFAKKYQEDIGFADSFRNAFLSGCHKSPDEYIVQ